MTISREAIFISHATPGDNVFARWLGAKLTALGYEVWADVLRLHGGLDWQRELETALRERAIKVLVVCTPDGIQKQGVRNEIQIASDLSKKLKDPNFIIPLRLADFEAPFLIAHLQYIDFKSGWAAGLAELLDTLDAKYHVPRPSTQSGSIWHATQLRGATDLIDRPEPVISNWLRIEALPSKVRYLEPPAGFPPERFAERSNHRWPAVPTLNGVVTFAEPDALGTVGTDIPAKKVRELGTAEFLENGWPLLGVAAFDARRIFTDLANQAVEGFFHRKRLTAFDMANRRRAWWGNIKTVPLGQVAFQWNGWSGRRQIIGQSSKRGVHWHYGVTAQVRTAPLLHVRLTGRLLFSENGLDAISDAKRAHRLRRSFAKSWRNARWRDMLLAFLRWVFDGKQVAFIPVGDDERIELLLPPLAFTASVSVAHQVDDVTDEDDPDPDQALLDEDDESVDSEDAVSAP